MGRLGRPIRDYSTWRVKGVLIPFSGTEDADDTDDKYLQTTSIIFAECLDKNDVRRTSTLSQQNPAPPVLVNSAGYYP